MNETQEVGFWYLEPIGYELTQSDGKWYAWIVRDRDGVNAVSSVSLSSGRIRARVERNAKRIVQKEREDWLRQRGQKPVFVRMFGIPKPPKGPAGNSGVKHRPVSTAFRRQEAGK